MSLIPNNAELRNEEEYKDASRAMDLLTHNRVVFFAAALYHMVNEPVIEYFTRPDEYDFRNMVKYTSSVFRDHQDSLIKSLSRVRKTFSVLINVLYADKDFYQTDLGIEEYSELLEYLEGVMGAKYWEDLTDTFTYIDDILDIIEAALTFDNMDDALDFAESEVPKLQQFYQQYIDDYNAFLR